MQTKIIVEMNKFEYQKLKELYEKLNLGCQDVYFDDVKFIKDLKLISGE